jgi:hypothetical protein
MQYKLIRSGTVPVEMANGYASDVPGADLDGIIHI